MIDVVINSNKGNKKRRFGQGRRREGKREINKEKCSENMTTESLSQGDLEYYAFVAHHNGRYDEWNKKTA